MIIMEVKFEQIYYYLLPATNAKYFKCEETGKK